MSESKRTVIDEGVNARASPPHPVHQLWRETTLLKREGGSASGERGKCYIRGGNHVTPVELLIYGCQVCSCHFLYTLYLRQPIFVARKRHSGPKAFKILSLTLARSRNLQGAGRSIAPHHPLPSLSLISPPLPLPLPIYSLPSLPSSYPHALPSPSIAPSPPLPPAPPSPSPLPGWPARQQRACSLPSLCSARPVLPLPRPRPISCLAPRVIVEGEREREGEMGEGGRGESERGERESERGREGKRE